MRLGVIGCGNMGGALARGIISKKILPFNNIYISDKDANKVRALQREFGVHITGNEDLAAKCTEIIMAVKPQDSASVLTSISDKLGASAHIISVMAGVSISKIVTLTGKKIAVTRAMPNMAVLVGKSVTCICHNKLVKDRALTQRIFASVGEVVEIEERHMDAVTAISGSGPAYFFYLAEALKEAAVKLGIDRETAAQLTASTLAGSGALVENLRLAPEILRERITSKKGTTEVALNILRSKKFKDIVIEAVKVAAKRAEELSKEA